MSVFNKTLLTVDIETISNTSEKEDALNPFKNKITVIGVQNASDENNEVIVYRDLNDFKREIWDDPEFVFCGHNFKWDFKVLTHHLGCLPANGYEAYEDDTRLMAYVCTDKVDEEFISRYESTRKTLNSFLPPGINHRPAGLHSLKTLAPYFLGVEAFWENPADHDSDAYVSLDVRYTTQLRLFLREKLKKALQLDFYCNYGMPWARTLLQAEVTGINFDSEKLDELEKEFKLKEKILKDKISEQWKEAFNEYERIETLKLQQKYQEMFEKAYQKPTKKSKNVEVLQSKYKNLYDKAYSQNDFKFNLDSPTQMKWLLKDYLKYDIRNFYGEESTGVEVLERLAKSEPEIKTLLEYRETSKILTGFLPTYRQEEYKGKIHSTFNFDGTRTGRLSCSNPNLQQTPKSLKSLFKASPGKLIATYDLGAIEPVILAYFSQDKALCDLIFNGQSFHSLNAIEMFSKFMEPGITEPEVKDAYPGLRYVAKQCGLGVLYGAGWRRIQAEAMNHGYMLTEKECKNAVYGLRERYSGVWKFKQELDQELEAGAVLFNLYGRPFKIDNPEDVYMKGLNRLIQGSGSDLTMNAAYNISRIKGCTPIGFIHDSVLTEIDEDREFELCKRIEQEFTRFKLPVGDKNLPLTVEGGASDVWE